MGLVALECPNCGANYNPSKYQCEYCGSYIFQSKQGYKNFSDIKIELPKKPKTDNGKYPGIYVYGRLLGKGEKPISLGTASYSSTLTNAGGKLLLTNKSLLFSAHHFNVGRQEACIPLRSVTNARVRFNFLISQDIEIKTETENHYFLVYHGKEWVRLIKEAIANLEDEPDDLYYTSDKNDNIDIDPSDELEYVKELQQLKALLNAGIITEEEFHIKKRMILGI
ncbi:MAG: SHOCT domain-containing protein [Ruminococcaceae bacterium]|nr:SHOCT domain-containing protein [Oscillospiraceae bacterium]